MKTQIISFLALLVTTATYSQKSKFNIQNFYEIEKGHSYVEFSVLYMGYAKVKGRFADFEGMFRYNENDLFETSVSFNVKTESIDTDLDWRDKDLKSDAWLDAEKFPSITFQSKRISEKDNGFGLIGNLTIKGITKEVTITMNPPSGVLSDTRGDSQVIFTGSIAIDRTEFGVEGKRWSKIKEGIAGVGSNVDIEFSILGKRMNARNISGWFRDETRYHSQVKKALDESGLKDAISKFRALKEKEERVNSNTLRLVGFYLLRINREKEALEMFKENAIAFPEESKVHTDLGEGYAENGDLKKARMAYEKALTIEPQNTKATEVLRHLE